MIGLNREGTARGPDMTFTTSAPSAPFVTTLPADVTGATEVLLQAEIRPNGLATVGHFDYGLDAGYGMTTPNFEFPAERGGNISVRIGSADDTPVGVDWVARSNAPSSWQAIASSADGMKLVAVPATFGKIHTSEDGGQTWVPRDVDRDWVSVASSSDGLRLVAVEYRGWIYTSSDGGVTWGSAKSTPVSTRWSQVASSADGSRLVLVVNGGGIYTSKDGGLAWMQQPGAPSSYWYAVASSADGLRLVAAPNGGYIHVSRDGGETWTATESNRGWRGVASSADGMHLAAAAWPSALMVSSNGGMTWSEGQTDSHPLDAPSVYRNWSAIAASADGSKLVAAEYSGRIYTSTDGGGNWVAGIQSPVAAWKSLATSADGSRLAAAALSKPIYTSAFSGGFTPDLRPNTTYHYRVVGANSEGSAAGGDLTFTTDAAAVEIRMPTIREMTGAGATLPALVNPGGLSSTGYFEYGLDAGYGNRTEPVSLPAGTDWVQVSAPITGLLPLATYHYRWVGTNLAGLSTGADMAFTTPKPPSLAIPVAADLTANSAILTGEINPNAAVTVGYFEYGADANYGSLAGFTPLPTGITWDALDGYGPLPSGTNWMALNARINSLSGPAGEDWSPQAVANANWSSLASSADGNKLVAVAYGGGIHTSTDGGSTWTPGTNAPTAYWQSVASSADGARLVALEGGFRLSGGGRIYTSTDGGANWVARTQAPAAAWRAVASSADGSRLVALAYAGGIYFSMDRGETWSRGIGAPEIYWSSVAASADGLRFVAVGKGGMYFSENGGATWTLSHTAPAVDWLSVAVSADGMKLVAGVNMGGIYTSTDRGVTWTERTSAPGVGIWALGSSADGTRLVAASYRGRIYTSTDSGVTWVARESSRNWQCIAMSVDGTRLIAGDYAGALYMSSGLSTPFQPGTSYHCRIVGINQEGTVFGEDMTFRTIGTAPAVTTLAATEIDATLQARLNGSVIPNGSAALVYFEYGLDTSYGFFTPTNTVTGEAGPQPVSFVIGGLSAKTTYHYRLAAVSVDGLSKGEDLVFETPSLRSLPGTEKPTAVTEPVTSTENRVTLKGTVHPNGLETLVYFQIGEDTEYGSIVGRRSLASDLLETPVGADLSFDGEAAEPLWVAQFGAPLTRWQAVASSSDGNHILAAAFGGRLYTSSDGGSTWTARDSERFWRCVASSAEGDKLFAAEYGGGIYTSSDGGFTWTLQSSAPNEYWECLVASADGTKLVAAAAGTLATSELGNGQVYTSSDGGVTWILSETSPRMQWTGLAISSDGNEVVGCGIDESGVGGLYRSTNGGQSWAAMLDTPAGVGWRSVASSADGTKLVAMVGGFLNGIYTSTDGGLTWGSQPGAPDANWSSVASSADGMSLVAVAEKSGLGVSLGGAVYLSSDGGVTWVLQEGAPAAMWRSVASSADGTKLVAVEDGDEAGGLIYTYGGSVAMPFLVPGLTYHYRLVASNSAGTTLGQDLTFSTAVNNRVQVVPQATTVVPGGGFFLSFTGDPGLSFTVLMSSDAGLPLEEWSELGQPVEYPPGTYQFLDEEGGDGVRFYRVSSP
ncbi:MAG: WD40/YVTN/BNR-like repeat-containing protein [Limisphaerales bacterium]